MHGTGLTVMVNGCEVSVFVCFNPDTEETRKYRTNGWHAGTSAIPLVSGCASAEEAATKAKEMIRSSPAVLEEHRRVIESRTMKARALKSRRQRS